MRPVCRGHRFLHACLIGLLLAVCAFAAAHDPGISGLRLVQRDSDFIVTVDIHLSRLLKVEGLSDTSVTNAQISAAIARRLRLRIDGKDYQPENVHLIVDKSADLVSWQSVTAGKYKNVEVLQRIVPEDSGSQTLVTLMDQGMDGTTVSLDREHPDLLLDSHRPHGWGLFGQFVWRGIEHILSGPDHILFVLGLLLLGGSLKSLLTTVTSFTAAHSVTLALAATGVLNPPSRYIEPLIALSIVAIAVENLRPKRAAPGEKTRDFRPYVAFGFGLIHGFGFAGAITEAGIAKSSLPIVLSAFNVGVELGQASIILLAAPLIALAVKLSPARWERAARWGSIGIAAVGSYWFIERVINGG